MTKQSEAASDSSGQALPDFGKVISQSGAEKIYEPSKCDGVLVGGVLLPGGFTLADFNEALNLVLRWEDGPETHDPGWLVFKLFELCARRVTAEEEPMDH